MLDPNSLPNINDSSCPLNKLNVLAVIHSRIGTFEMLYRYMNFDLALVVLYNLISTGFENVAFSESVYMMRMLPTHQRDLLLCRYLYISKYQCVLLIKNYRLNEELNLHVTMYIRRLANQTMY